MCDCRVCELEDTYPDDFEEIIDDTFKYIVKLEY